MTFSAEVLSARWQRVELILNGKLNTNGEKNFYLRDGDRSFAINAKISADEFTVALNVSAATPSAREIPNGEWVLCLGYEPVRFNCDVEERRFFENGDEASSCYSVIPRKNGDGSISLCVELKVAGPSKLKRALRSPFKAVKYVVNNLADSLIFKVTNALAKHDGKYLLFTSDSRAALSGNEQLVYERMVERGLDKQFNINMIFKSNIHAHRKFTDKFRLPYLLGRADVIIVDDYDPSVNYRKYNKNVKIIQLWHACGAFKAVGYSRMGKSGGGFVTSGNHRIYTHAIVSSDAIAPYYAEAFAMDISRIYPTGVPRTDVFFDENYRQATRSRLLDEMPQLKGKRVILFAPTFRGDGPKTAYYPEDKIDFDALAEMCRKTGSFIIFKLHFLCKNHIEIPDKYKDIMIDETDSREINDLLFITDVLVTDYSSVIYEASILDIPMVFYAYDLDEYVSSRDFYEPYRSFVPGKIAETSDEMIVMLENNDFDREKVAAFRERNFQFRDGKSTDRVIDWLILGDEKNV